jgi:hypothetical protein
MWRVCNAIMASFLAMAAYVQHNDPDSAYWISVYAVASLICAQQTLSPTAFGHLRLARILLRSALFCYTFIELHCLILYASHVIDTIQVSSSEANSTADQRSSLIDGDPKAYGLLDSEPGRESVGVLIILVWISVSIRINSDLLSKAIELRKNRALHGIDLVDQIDSLQCKEKFAIFLISIVPIVLWAYHLAKGLHLC